jgi:hypothetical protein
MGYRYETYCEELLNKSAIKIEGSIESYTVNMGAHRIHYSYEINGVAYDGAQSITGASAVDSLVGKTDLKIEYSPEDNSVSRVIDKRFRN